MIFHVATICLALLGFFSSLSPINNYSSFATADDSSMNVNHKASISSNNQLLSDTFLIPSLNFNLIYVGQFCDYGYNVNFSQLAIVCRIRRRDESSELVIELNVYFSLPPASSFFVFHNTSLCNSTHAPLSLWNQCLGHSSLNKLHPLISNGLLGDVNGKILDCIACQHANNQPYLLIIVLPFMILLLA